MVLGRVADAAQPRRVRTVIGLEIERMLTLIVYGGFDAWNSFQIGETTSTPWNPVIWPVKAAIPLAGVLLLLQGVSNLVRDLGWVPGGIAR